MSIFFLSGFYYPLWIQVDTFSLKEIKMGMWQRCFKCTGSIRKNWGTVSGEGLIHHFVETKDGTSDGGQNVSRFLRLFPREYEFPAR
jgi:hypothetical protein